MNLLVIIDVQGSPRITAVQRDDGRAMTPQEEATARAHFFADVSGRFDLTLTAICREIRQAGRVMILEEVEAPNRTHPAILHALGPRPHLLARKRTYDGSAVVLEAMLNYGVADARLTVCGSMTSVCVLKTVRGLRKALGAGRVSVAADACFDQPWSEELLEPELREG